MSRCERVMQAGQRAVLVLTGLWRRGMALIDRVKRAVRALPALWRATRMTAGRFAALWRATGATVGRLSGLWRGVRHSVDGWPGLCRSGWSRMRAAFGRHAG